MSHPLDSIVTSTSEDQPTGIAAVCCAHPFVIEAALDQDKHRDLPVLTEATSTQVDQFDGYTGMRSADFRKRVEHIAHRVGFLVDRTVLGGDRPWPNRWRALPAQAPTAHVDGLVPSYVDQSRCGSGIRLCHRCGRVGSGAGVAGTIAGLNGP